MLLIGPLLSPSPASEEEAQGEEGEEEAGEGEEGEGGQGGVKVMNDVVVE